MRIVVGCKHESAVLFLFEWRNSKVPCGCRYSGYSTRENGSAEENCIMACFARVMEMPKCVFLATMGSIETVGT